MRSGVNRHEDGHECEGVVQTSTKMDSTSSNAPSSKAFKYGPSHHDNEDPRGPCPHPFASRCSSSPLTSSGQVQGRYHFPFSTEDRRPGFSSANRTMAQVSELKRSRAVRYEPTRSAGMQDRFSTESSERKRAQLGASSGLVDHYPEKTFACRGVDDTRSLPDNSSVPSMSFASSSDRENVEGDELEIEVSANSGGLIRTLENHTRDRRWYSARLWRHFCTPSSCKTARPPEQRAREGHIQTLRNMR